MLIGSLVTPLVKGQSTNSTAGSFTANTPTATRPAASATRTVIDSGPAGPKDRCTLIVYPYGGNANDDIINVKVIGWNRLIPPINNTDQTFLWVPTLVCEVQATLSSALLGVASAGVSATEFFADTLTLTNGIAVLYQNTTADLDIARFTCNVGTFELVEILGDLGTGGDTMNWLYGWE